MSTHVYRSYLYLDEQTVDDFLAGIGAGGLQDQKLVQTDSQTGTLSGGMDVKLAKANAQREAKGVTEVTQQSVITPAVKFQRLYDHLEAENTDHWYYESMDEETWAGIRRNSVLEVTTGISFTKLGLMATAVTDLANLTRVVEGVTGEAIIDSSSQAALTGMEQLAQLEANKEIPLKMTFVGSTRHTLITYLNPSFLKVAKQDLAGEVSAVVKILRKPSKGEKYEFFNPLEAANSLGLNREARRRQKKANPQMPAVLQDTVKGPAAVVIAVAIYR